MSAACKRIERTKEVIENGRKGNPAGLLHAKMGPSRRRYRRRKEASERRKKQIAGPK